MALPKIVVRYGWSTRANTGNYHTEDMEAFKQILDDHPEASGFSSVDRNDPASWETAGLVKWDNSSPKRIVQLFIANKNIKGALDVSGLKELTVLRCNNNKLTSLTVRNLTKLTELTCYYSQITSLNMENLTSLTTLNCYSNELLTLGITNLTNLTYLDCSDNQLPTLDVTNLTNLTYLICSDNQLAKIEGLDQLTQLKELYCNSNQFTETLEVGYLTQLTHLSCSKNQLTKLNGLGQLTSLVYMDCSNNQFAKLNGLEQLTQLTNLYCENNQLTGTLEVGNLTQLKYMGCYNNQLTKLNGLDQLGSLKELSCYNNQLTGTLDVGSLTQMTTLYCYNNQLTKLNGLEQLTLLERLSCSGNQLTGTLDVSNLTNLASLFCENNQLTELKGLGNLNNLGDFYCYNNPFTSFTTKDGHTLTVTPAVGGKVVMTTFRKEDNTVILTATPEKGYAFDQWVQLPSVAIPSGNTATFILNDNVSASAAFTVIPVQGVTLNKTELTLYTNKTPQNFQLAAMIEPDNAYDKNVSWMSDNPNVAKVEQDGTVTAMTTGTATITVKTNDGNKTATCTVTVKRANTDATLKSLALSSGTLTAAFDPAITSYTAAVDHSVSSVNITAEPNDTKAAVTGGGEHTLNEGENTVTITVTAENGTQIHYTILITRAKPPANNGNSSGTGGNDTVSMPQPLKTNTPVLAVIELPATVGNGTATGRTDEGRTASAISGARGDARANTNGIAVQYDVKTDTAYDGFSITIHRAVLDQLIAAGIQYLTLNTNTVDLTFDFAALQEMQKQTTGDVTLTAVRETGLTGDAQAAVGARPAYQIRVNYTGADGKAAAVQNFGTGRVTIGFAYKPAATEQSGSLFLVYSADGKSVEWLNQSSYNSFGSSVTGSTNHLSIYGVGCKPAPSFTDTVNHWAKADIDFVVSRGLLGGTSETTFTPDDAVTRGMFAAALGRLAGIDPAAYPSSSRYTDVDATAYYAPYVEWAAANGIVTGTGVNTFSPDSAILREEMAVIMQRYAAQLGYSLPVSREAEIFTDAGQITNSMKSAVQAMQQAGVMNTKGGRRFGPKDAATRAEAAAVLRRFVEIVMNHTTAGGWGQNDVGRWLYYENSRPVTGWKLIDHKWYYFDTAGLMESGGWKEIGGKWYYFYPDGAMAANTRIDGYEIGPDGARKETEV